MLLIGNKYVNVVEHKCHVSIILIHTYICSVDK